MKLATEWRQNPSAEANEYPYDSDHTYDSDTRNYDGVVDGDLSDRDVLPAAWENTGKDPNGWAEDISELYAYDDENIEYDSEKLYDGFVDSNRKNPTVWRSK